MCKRPRLTQSIIDGVHYTCSELRVTIEARQAWGDEYPQDAKVEKTLQYLEHLEEWWKARHRCKKGDADS